MERKVDVVTENDIHCRPNEMNQSMKVNAYRVHIR